MQNHHFKFLAGHPNFFLMDELSVKPKAYFLDREWLRCGSLLSLYLINNGKKPNNSDGHIPGLSSPEIDGCVDCKKSGFEIVVSSNS